MARQSNDTWDLASGVGATATACAATRALASRRYPHLIHDPYAESLVDAVGITAYLDIARGQASAEIDGVPDDSDLAYTVARTKFFDEFLLHATIDCDIRQVVILASGLDTRSHRLAWPTGTVVFDVDQPDVVSFKIRTLHDIGVTTSASTTAVGVDLRDDWPAALAAAHFSPERPTAWIAEGLFGYLPPDAQDRLLDLVTELSVPSSRFAIEYVDAPDLLEAMNTGPGGNTLNVANGESEDTASLIYGGPRHPIGDYLAARQWNTTSVNARDLRTRYELPPADDSTSLVTKFAYISALLNSGD